MTSPAALVPRLHHTLRATESLTRKLNCRVVTPGVGLLVSVTVMVMTALPTWPDSGVMTRVRFELGEHCLVWLNDFTACVAVLVIDKW